MSDALVSVIVAAFNARRFLRESIESIFEQDYRPFEVHVVDDGSSDDSPAVAAAIADRHPELRVVRQAQNRGPAAARNIALAMARGAFVTFLDADDRMASGRLSHQVAYLRQRPDIDVVIGTQEIVVEAGVDLPAWLRGPQKEQPRHATMSMMVRRPLFDRVGAFDPSLRVGSDADWLYRASAAEARIAMIDRVMIYRRIHGQNLTYRVADLRRTILRSLRARIADRRPPQ